MRIALGKPLMSVDGKLKLSKEIKIGDGEAATTADVIDLDLDALTGADVEACIRDATAAKGELVRVLAIDNDLHLQVASKASGIAANDLRRLRAPDYVEVVTAVQGFLTGQV